jgi:ElaB/YqjD/DUF883 family membrane-anchored ribosome-binding protein
MTTTENQSPSDEDATVERLERVLDEWRARIDELLVQADLASKDVSESVRAKATTAQNAYLAAKNQLSRIPKDAGANIGSLRSGVEKLIDDVRQAYEAAEATIGRSRDE